METINHHLYTRLENADKKYPVYRINNDGLSILDKSDTLSVSLKSVKIRDTRFLNMGSNIDKKYIEECIMNKKYLKEKEKIKIKNGKVCMNITDEELKMLNTALLAEIPEEIFFDYDELLQKMCQLKICELDIIIETKKEFYDLINFGEGVWESFNYKCIKIYMSDFFDTTYLLFQGSTQDGVLYLGPELINSNSCPNWTKMVIYPELIIINKITIFKKMWNYFQKSFFEFPDLPKEFFDKFFDLSYFDMATLVKNNFLINNEEMFVLSFDQKIRVPPKIKTINIILAKNIDNLPDDIEYLNICFFVDNIPKNFPFLLKKISSCEYILRSNQNHIKINYDELKIPFGCQIEIVPYICRITVARSTVAVGTVARAIPAVRFG